MLARASTATLIGINAHPITVEVDIDNGLPAFIVVGLPDTAVKESRERVRSAIKNSGFSFPDGIVTVNLAPADIKKEGSHLDAAIALGILTATNQAPRADTRSLIVGELALDGSLKPIRGAISMAHMASKENFHTIFLPAVNAPEAAVFKEVKSYAVQRLSDLVAHLQGETSLRLQPPPSLNAPEARAYPVDFSDVHGQWQAKRALTIAAAGGHNILMMGPPGTGKSLLAQRLPTILPPMELEEALETTQIHSAASLLPAGISILWQRPFRAPHHTISYAGLTGGGTTPRPGEITLANNGVLFLDELTEFKRDALESLRQPMENGRVTITRSNRSITYPSRFMLVAAMNPCPCGNLGNPKVPCRCTPHQISRYRAKISGPLLDRIDLHVEVPALSYDDFTSREESTSSARVREAVIRARSLQAERMKGRGRVNAMMGPKEIETFCTYPEEVAHLLKTAMDRYGLSGRSIHRTLKVARTIADLEGAETIQPAHVAEGLQFRLPVTSPETRSF